MAGYYKVPRCSVSSLPIKTAAYQRGAVLILALLIVALVATMGIRFAGDYQLGLARAESRWHGAQARAYGYMAEGVAVVFLKQDDPAYDALDEPWARKFDVEVDGGMLAITMADANSQFNLNSLIGVLDPGKDAMDPSRYSPSQRMFIRLLQTFPELVPGQVEAISILEAIVDWTDPDSDPTGMNGAEDSYYLSLSDAYRPANAPFQSLEELRMVRGVLPDLMKVLRPYLMVLPSSSGLNVNTVPPLLYRCINISNDLQPLDEAQANTLIPPLGSPYKQMGEFEALVSKLFGAGVEVDITGLTVATDLFWLTTQAQIGEQRRTARSLLHRSTPAFEVWRREEVY